jgi:hypothetical protein
VRTIISVIVTVLVFAVFCPAQERKNEAGFLLGAELIPERSTSSGTALSFSDSVSFSATYARHLTGRRTELLLEFPFAASPSHSLASAQEGTITSLASLYVTPSLRVRFLNARPFSPWVSGGVGYGLYQGSQTLNSGARNPAVFQNTTTVQFGGGVDFRTPLHVFLPISLRLEARDYHTLDTPNFGVGVRGGSQDNVIAAGGFVIHF